MKEFNRNVGLKLFSAVIYNRGAQQLIPVWQNSLWSHSNCASKEWSGNFFLLLFLQTQTYITALSRSTSTDWRRGMKSFYVMHQMPTLVSDWQTNKHIYTLSKISYTENQYSLSLAKPDSEQTRRHITSACAHTIHKHADWWAGVLLLEGEWKVWRTWRAR